MAASTRRCHSVGYFGARARATVLAWGVAILIAFPVVAGFAIFAMRRADLRDPIVAACLAVCLSGLVIHAITYGDARYHLPLVPPIAVLGAAGFKRDKAPSPLGARVGVAIALLLAAIWVADSRELLPKLAIVAGADGSGSGVAVHRGACIHACWQRADGASSLSCSPGPSPGT